MNDVTGREIEPNQKVLFTVGTRIVFGTVVNTRVRTYGTIEYPLAKVLLDTPEERHRQRRNGLWIANPAFVEGGIQERYIYQPNNEEVQEPLAPRRTRDVYGSERIYILDNPEK